jgi:miniconductance mechanosensitive channel
LQGSKIVVGIIAAILIFSFLLDKSPIYLLTGLGAATAILMLIFKDTIMNFVGGVQVTANDLVQIGDWIEMPKYGADGDVIDISLNTVKVQNFDRTITTIPTYALVSDSFKNWRGMIQTGGRRIMRSVTIDLKSIKFCDNEMIDRFEGIKYLQEYIKTKRVEIDDYNKKNNIDNTNIVNGRRLTNIGTFRAYIENYLANHPNIHRDMIFMVRQLQADEKGVPLQIYAFTNDVAWKNFEKIQSDIFDHIFAVIPFFDLKVFQFPTELSMTVDYNKELKAD